MPTPDNILGVKGGIHRFIRCCSDERCPKCSGLRYYSRLATIGEVLEIPVESQEKARRGELAYVVDGKDYRGRGLWPAGYVEGRLERVANELVL